MKICKMVPPAAAMVSARDLYRGVTGLLGKGRLESLKEELKVYFGTEYAFPVSSGKAALALILKVLSSLRSRKKVIAPAYTCYSVPASIRKSGLEIVLCDLKPETLDFDYPQLERLVAQKPLCVISTHLFGIPADVERTRRICGENGIFLVEDAAQAMGGVYSGRKLGTIGDVGFFSLGRGKNITCGSGGVIVTNSREIAGEIEKVFEPLGNGSLLDSTKALLELSLMGCFMNPNLYWFPAGLPFLNIGETIYCEYFPIGKLNKAKSGAMYYWKEKLERSNRTRLYISEQYKAELNVHRNIGIYSGEVPYLRFPIYLENEEVKKTICKEYGRYGVSGMYPGSIDSISEIKDVVSDYRCPASARIASKLVTLPTHDLVAGAIREKICEGILKVMDHEYRIA